MLLTTCAHFLPPRGSWLRRRAFAVAARHQPHQVAPLAASSKLHSPKTAAPSRASRVGPPGIEPGTDGLKACRGGRSSPRQHKAIRRAGRDWTKFLDQIGPHSEATGCEDPRAHEARWGLVQPAQTRRPLAPHRCRSRPGRGRAQARTAARGRGRLPYPASSAVDAHATRAVARQARRTLARDAGRTLQTDHRPRSPHARPSSS